MSEIPKHITDRNDWTVQQTVDYARTGEPPINPEWIERRNEALVDAGLEPEQTEPTELEDMSPEEHEKRRDQ